MARSFETSSWLIELKSSIQVMYSVSDMVSRIVTPSQNTSVLSVNAARNDEAKEQSKLERCS